MGSPEAGAAAQPVDPMTESLADLIAHGPDAAMPVPDASEPMVVKSLRLPLRLADALEQEAAVRGIGVTVLMRELLETALRDPAQQRYVPLDEAITMLSRLARGVPPAA
jgi:hypothetical protein